MSDHTSTGPHAAVRAAERYGITVSRLDLDDFCRRCKTGEGHLETDKHGMRQHLLIHGDRLLWVIYSLPQGGIDPLGRIITIMPPQVGKARAERDAIFRANRRAGRSGDRKKVRFRGGR